MRLTILVVLMCLLSISANADTFLISKGNQAKAAIVISRSASEPMRVGAQEIQKHIEMIGGAKLPIIEVASTIFPSVPDQYDGYILISNSDIDPKTGKSIKYASEEFSIRTVPGKHYQIRISGDKKRGAIYGCYTFLEDVLGFRWYTPTITKVPKVKTLKVKNIWIRQKPAFEYREPFFTEAFDKFWAVRNKTNGNTQQLDDSVGGKITYGRFVHTFAELVPQSYFPTHPEYFSLIDGKRMEGYAQLCLTNPDVLKISIAKVREWLKNDTKSVIFSVSQNDTGYPCECENCKAVVEEEGAQSGPIIRFVNAIAEDIAKDYPDVLIDTLAYWYSEAPPKHVKPVKNVRIRMAPITNCVGHPMDKCERNKKPYENLLAWSKITDQLYIWHYSTNFANYLMPLPCFDDINTSVPIYKKYGAVGLFYQGSYQSPGGALAEIKSYLLAKLMWNPSVNSKAVINDYLKGVYGKSAGTMGQWIDLLHSEVRKSLNNHAFIYDSPKNVYMTEKVISKSYELLDKAAKASANDPQASREIKKARMWMEYVSLTNNNAKYKIEGDQYKAVGDQIDEETKASFARNLTDFNVTHIREGDANVAGFLGSLGKSSSYKAYKLENDLLKVDIVPGIGGRIIGLTPKKVNQNVFKEASGLLNLASGGYEEFFNHEYHGPGYSENYVVDASKSNGNTLVMTLDKFSPIMVSRTVSLEGNTLTISTSFTNNGSTVYTGKMRSHPEFNIPADSKPSASFVSVAGNKVDYTFPSTEENKFFTGNDVPNGKWSVDLGSYVLTNTFDIKMVSRALLNATMASKRFNLELYSAEYQIEPGKTATFTNKIAIDQK